MKYEYTRDIAFNFFLLVVCFGISKLKSPTTMTSLIVVSKARQKEVSIDIIEAGR